MSFRRAPMPSLLGRSAKRSAGQALVELALIAPVILLLLMGLVQFALIYEREIGITNAVREAARRAATIETPDAGVAAANASWTLTTLQSLLGNAQSHEASRDDLEVCILTPSPPNDVTGEPQVVVRIVASYRHPLFLPIITQILDGLDGVQDDSLKATTQTEFHVEQENPVNIGSGGAARTNGSTTPCAP